MEIEIGTLVHVEIDGLLVFPQPVAVKSIFVDGQGKQWVLVEGSQSAVPKENIINIE